MKGGVAPSRSPGSPGSLCVCQAGNRSSALDVAVRSSAIITRQTWSASRSFRHHIASAPATHGALSTPTMAIPPCTLVVAASYAATFGWATESSVVSRSGPRSTCRRAASKSRRWSACVTLSGKRRSALMRTAISIVRKIRGEGRARLLQPLREATPGRKSLDVTLGSWGCGSVWVVR